MEKYNKVINAYTTMQKGENTIHILDTDYIKDMATQNAILDIQRWLETEFEIGYEIMADACACISDVPYKDLSKVDFYETETSSIYTAVRLDYLSTHNEGEISELVKEYDCDIQTACAIWYNNKVAEACNALIDYILK